MNRVHVVIQNFFSKNVFLAKYEKVILYFIFGCTAASIDLSVYLLLFNFFNINPVFATIFSISLATIVGFILNAFVNFKVRDRIFFRFLSYAMVSGVGILLSSGTLHIFYNVYGFDGNIVKIGFLPVIFLVQYSLNSAISFRKSKNSSE